MLYLLLRVLCSTGFSHLVRFSQSRVERPMAAMGINYAVGAVACGLWAAVAGAWNLVTVGLGALAGFCYVGSLLLLLPAMRRSGVAVVGAVSQLSMMVPVAVAAVAFREYPSLLQGVGIGLTMLALPLLSASARGGHEAKGGFSFLTLGLFLSIGTSQTVMKQWSAMRPAPELPLYSAALFLSATLFTYAWMLITGDTGRAEPMEGTRSAEAPKALSERRVGTYLGVANVLQLVFLLMALRELPAAVVFPASAALGIVSNAVASVLLWKEQPIPAAWCGIGLSIVAVLLLSWR